MKVNKQALEMLRLMRPSQWVKNLSILATLIFNGQLFNFEALLKSGWTVVAFCFLSSFSYIVNDMTDMACDRKHPVKKNRPLAKKTVSIKKARLWAGALLILGLGITWWLGKTVFWVGIGFVVLHLGYSLFLKRYAIYDIMAISFSFILRAFAGEAASGYPLPIWLLLTIVFLSLFIASGKRMGELKIRERETRSSLKEYEAALLNFYLSVFAVATLMAYMMFTFTAALNFPSSRLGSRLFINLPQYANRKWFMLTLFPVIFGLMRYGQLIFVKEKGEKPEKLLTSDWGLLGSVLLWGILVIFFIYAF